MSVDNLVLTAYTETELGNIIESAILRALQKMSPASMNLDNRTECRRVLFLVDFAQWRTIWYNTVQFQFG